MDKGKNLSRRDFVKLTTLSAGAITLAVGSSSIFQACSNKPKAEGLFLSESEFKLVEAIAEQIIPTDEWPGGRDAGVAVFIDKQLVGPYKRFQEDYRKGLEALQNTCEKKFHNKFEKLPWDSQTAVLRDMEAGKLEGDAWKNGFSKKYFELLRSHCMQGYYGSPRHGGNKNYISYKMIGIDQPPIVGENRI
jgi:gluconate 2-dehydrogenase gamma chain